MMLKIYPPNGEDVVSQDAIMLSEASCQSVVLVCRACPMPPVERAGKQTFGCKLAEI